MYTLSHWKYTHNPNFLVISMLFLQSDKRKYPGLHHVYTNWYIPRKYTFR